MQDENSWLKALCITAIALGLLGTCCDFSSLLMLPFSEQMAPGQKAIVAAQRPLRPFVYVRATLDLVQGTFLVVGASLVLRQNARGKRILSYALRAGVLLSGLAVPLLLALHFRQQAALSTASHLPAGVGSALGWAGLAFGLAWNGAKLAFFVWSARYLARNAALAGRT